MALTKEFDFRRQDPKRIRTCSRPSANPKRSPMYILRALVLLLFLTRVRFRAVAGKNNPFSWNDNGS